MDKYLIAVDLDGTLIPGLYDISEYTIKVFNELRKKGHKIVITTGRPFRSSFFVYYKFNLDTPLINYNGGYISNPKDMNYKVYSDMMKKEEILDIYKNNLDNFYLFFSEAYDHIYSNIDDEDVYTLMHHNLLSTLVVGDLNKILDSDLHGTLILAKPGMGEKIKEYVFKNHKNIGSRIWEWGKYKEIVELYSLNSNKGNALKMVRESLGFEKDKVIACGDSQNDFEFFSEAEIKIVPKNADERLKKIATTVLSTNVWDDAIADYFNKTFNLGVEKSQK